MQKTSNSIQVNDKVKTKNFVKIKIFFNPICLRVFLFDYPRIVSPHPLRKPNRKIFLTWNFAQSYFAMLQEKWQKQILKISAIGMMASLIMPIFFLKTMRKMAKICFFLKLTLWYLEKTFSRYFSAFESQDNI